MAFTTVIDKAAGDVFTEVMWDTYIKDNINFLAVPPMVRAVRTTDAAYTSNTAFTFQSVASGDKGFDTDVMFAAGSPTRITIKTAGIYSVTFGFYVTGTSVTYSQAYLRMNGGTNLAELDGSAPTGIQVLGTIAITYPFAVNDYIEALSVVTGTSHIQKGTGVPMFFSAVWIGKTTA